MALTMAAFTRLPMDSSRAWGSSPGSTSRATGPPAAADLQPHGRVRDEVLHVSRVAPVLGDDPERAPVVGEPVPHGVSSRFAGRAAAESRAARALAA